MEHVVARSADQPISPGPSPEPISTGVARETIEPGVPPQGVSAGSTTQPVVIGGSRDRIVAPEPQQDIVPGCALHRVVTRIAGHTFLMEASQRGGVDRDRRNLSDRRDARKLATTRMHLDLMDMSL